MILNVSLKVYLIKKYYFDYSQSIFKFWVNSLVNQLEATLLGENIHIGGHHSIFLKQANILALED